METLGFEWQGKKVLVTGASGFKGSWLCAVLSKLGAIVHGTTRQQANPVSAYSVLGLDDSIIKAHMDLSDRQDVYDRVNSFEPDVIFHLGAKALVPSSLRDPRRTFAVNIAGTINVIEACRRLGVCSRLLICSTDHVFGYIEPHELPKGGFKETDRVSYGGPYDTSKAAMELVVRSYHRTYWDEVPAIGITRCANVFGYGDINQRRVIPLFVTSALGSGSISLKYRQNGRQFIHVADAVAGYILAASSLDEGGRSAKVKRDPPQGRKPFTPTYHFALEDYGNPAEPFIRMGVLAKKVGGLLSSKVEEAHDCVDYAKNENKIQALNCAETKRILAWEAKRSLDNGILQLAKWYKAGQTRAALELLIKQDIEEIVNAIKS